jgi:hypothetical protein
MSGIGGDNPHLLRAAAAAYTAAMERLPPTLRTGHWNGPFAPLSLAVYITWLAVATGPRIDWTHGRLHPGWELVAGAAGMLAVLLLFVLRSRGREPGGGDDPRLVWLMVLPQLPAALLACWALGGRTPVLLIIVAGELAVLLPPRAVILLMLGADLPLLAMLVQRYGWSEALSDMCAYAGFQIFAGLVTGYARKAETARDDALRLNAELLATRQLLMESVRGEEHLRLHARQPEQDGPRVLAECERLADELLGDVRGVVSALRRDEGIPLQQALSALAPALPQPQVLLELAPQARAPGVAQAQALLRCAQEGLTNALRHSGAARVVIRLREEDAGIGLSVEDDGRARQLHAWLPQAQPAGVLP